MKFKEKMKKLFTFIKDLLFKDNHHAIRIAVSSAMFFLSLFMLDVGFRWIYSNVGVSPLGKEVPLYFTLAWCAILTAIGFFLPRIARRIYNIVIVVFYCVFATVHAFMASFFGNFFTVSSALFAGDGAAFFDWSYFDIPKKFIALLLACVFLAVISALILPKTKYKLVPLVSAALVLVLSVVGIRLCENKFFTDDGALVWDTALPPADVYETFADPNTCLPMVGFYQYTFKDLSIVSGLDDLLDSLSNADKLSALDDYYSNREIDPDNEMTGIFKDKNLIFIQLESIDTWMVNDIAMPYFSSLCEKSINFTNFYAPKYLAASTFNTEVIANVGLVPPMNSSRTTYFTENYYPYSIANLFANEGYSVESFHRSNPTIYNRGKAHTNWGYSAYNTGAAMGMENVNLDSDLMDGYDKFVKDEKFMSFVITYSGHGPYTADTVEVGRYYDIIRPLLPDDVKDEYVWALCHAYETDVFIKELCEKLEAEGILDDTVLCFYSDHYDHYVTDKEILYSYKGTADPNLLCHIPFAIYNSECEGMTVEKTVATYDILPTIVNLFDLDCDGRYYFGNDAFSEGGGYVIFSNKSWFDGETYFDVTKDSPTELSRERAEEINERLDASWNTIKLDYFKKIKK